MTGDERMVGRFDNLKEARDYAKSWKKEGYTVKVIMVKTWDVVIVGLPKGGSA